MTLYGVVDTGYRSVTSGDNKFSGMANGNNSSNRLGFKGTEDLGNSLKANFVLEGDLTPNDGTAAGLAFKRQSTVGLSGNFGEVRLGRDYTPAFRVFGIVDPFGTVGVGSAGNIMWSTVVGVGGSPSSQDVQDFAGTFTTLAKATATGSAPAGVTTARATIADPNLVRANNSFAYYSPSYNGFSAAAMYSAGVQNTYSLKNQGKMTGLSGTYVNGPLTVALATQETKGGWTQAQGTGLNLTTGTDDQKMTTNFLAGSYNFGMLTAAAGYRTEKLVDASMTAAKSNSAIYSLSAPVGAVTLKASYITKKAEAAYFTEGSIKAGNQVAVGAVYDLSKRTAFYATYAVLKNEAGFANNVGSAAASADGVKSKGFDIGVRHNF